MGTTTFECFHRQIDKHAAKRDAKHTRKGIEQNQQRFNMQSCIPFT